MVYLPAPRQYRPDDVRKKVVLPYRFVAGVQPAGTAEARCGPAAAHEERPVWVHLDAAGSRLRWALSRTNSGGRSERTGFPRELPTCRVSPSIPCTRRSHRSCRGSACLHLTALLAASPPTMIADVRPLRFRRTEVVPDACPSRRSLRALRPPGPTQVGITPNLAFRALVCLGEEVTLNEVV
jgi:hypothetical protein